jgi:hypothetical protein
MKPKLTCLLLLIVFKIHAQTNFKSGYIVLNNNDSIRGEINYKSWFINPSNIEFRQAGIIKSYGIKDLSSFSIDNEDLYKRANIEHQTNPIEISKAKDSYSTTTVKEEVWLRCLYISKLSLYELNTPDRSYYFYQDNSEGVFKELVYRVRVVNGALEKDEQYKNQLIALAKSVNSKLAEQESFNTSYSIDALIKVFRYLNQNQSAYSTVKKNGVVLELNATVSFYSFSISGDPNPYPLTGTLGTNIADYSSTPSIKIEAGFNFLSGRRFNRIQPRLGIGIQTITINAENTKGYYTFDKEKYSGTGVFAQTSFSLGYIVNPRSLFRFGGVGKFAHNLCLTKNAITATLQSGNNVTTLKGVPSLSEFLSYGAGVYALYKRSKISLLYEKTADMAGKNLGSTNTVLTASMVSLSYAWLFPNKKMRF